MKRIYSLLIICLFAQFAQAQLNGAYTINPSGSGTTNYTSFTAAVSALTSQGVSGNVTFTVAAATYNERITIPAINGVSSTRTITFNGGNGNAATRILQYNFASTSNYGIVDLNGADYITFKNITVKSTNASYGWGFLIRNTSSYTNGGNPADYNTVDSCIIDLSQVTTTGTNSIGVCFSASPNSYSTWSNQGNYNKITNNRILGSSTGGAYYGISFYGYPSSGGSYCTGNQFNNNVIQDFYSAGILTYYMADALTIKGNDISRPNRNSSTTLFGIQMEYYHSNRIVDGNKIHNLNGNQASNGNAVYGIRDYYGVAQGTSYTRNNAIYDIAGTGVIYGIYAYYSYYTRILNNTISLDHASSNNNAMYGLWWQLQAGTTQYAQEFKNNIVSVNRPGNTGSVRYAAYWQDNSPCIVDNNVYFAGGSAGSNFIGSFNGSDFTSFEDYQNRTSGVDANSVNAAPMFVNIISDVTPQNCRINNIGASLTQVTTDITGASRGASPDPGAYEFTAGGANDAAIAGVTSPSGTICTTGNKNLTVTLKNIGSATLTSATINYSINSTSQTPYSWTGSLANGASTAVTIGTINYTSNSSFNIITYSSSPNGSSDACAANDTISIIRGMGLSGTYTIDASGSGVTNFTNFNNAATALKNRGVCGPVTFNVASGTYNERFTLPSIAGASATNTITFNGGNGNAASRILQYNFAITSNNGIVDLNGADYVTFKNITVKTTHTSYGWGFLLRNQANYNHIDSCIIDLSAATSVTTNVMGICVTNSTNNISAGGDNANYCKFSNNQILGSASGGGYRGISFYGSTNSTTQNTDNQILNNTIQDFYESGIYISYYAPKMRISGNLISRPNRTGSTSVYGIYSYQYAETRIIEKNKIFSMFEGNTSNGNQFMGIAEYYSYNYGGNIIRNNAIYNIRSTGPQYGIYSMYCYDGKILNNTISLDNSTTNYNTIIALNLEGTQPGYVKEVKNNIFSVNSPSGGGARYGLYSSAEIFATVDYNVYYINASGANNYISYYNQSDYATMGIWKTVAGYQFDQNSTVYNPLFSNLSSNVTPTSCAINGLGTPLGADVADDITGGSRPSTNPDPGAYEFTAGGVNDASVTSITNPGNILCLGSQTVMVTLRNAGTATLTSATINWAVNGTGQTPYSWSGSVAPGASVSVGVGTYNFSSSPVVVRANSSSPNGVSDACVANDTTITPSLQAGLTGNLTIDASGSGNYMTFYDAIADLKQYGVCGPVVFNVAPGTYYEQVVLTPVFGASSANTITFDGGTGNATSVILEFMPSGSYAGVEINGGDYFRIKNMTIRPDPSVSAYVYGVNIRNRADYNIIDSCIIDFSTLTSYSGEEIGVCFSGANNYSSQSGDHGIENIIRGNQILGGSSGGPYYGISIYNDASYASGTKNNKIIGNVIQDFLYMGIRLEYNVPNVLISGNDISRPSIWEYSTVYGIYAQQDDNNVYEKNRIHNPFGGNPYAYSAFYGIYINGTYSPVPVTISNNLIDDIHCEGEVYGIYANGEYGLNVIHNTISIDDPNSSGYGYYTVGMYLDNCGYNYDMPCVVKNNIITITRSSSGSGYYYIYGLFYNYNEFASDFNDIYINSPYSYANFGYHMYYGDLSSLSQWQNYIGLDYGSTDVDPVYNNPSGGDYTPTTTSVNNMGTGTSVKYDKNNFPRNPNTPDPGSLEWGPACSGTPSVRGVLIDNGGMAVCGTSVLLTADFDVVGNLTYQWQSSTNGSSWNDINGATNFNYSTAPVTSALYYRCKVSCASNTANTTSTIVMPGMSGNYTINPSGSGTSNFTTFTAAADALASFGVCGPVTFTVSASTYTERITIPVIMGASSVNTITFNGGSGNAATRILSFAFSGSPSNYAVVDLNGADYLRFKNLTVRSTSSNYGFGFLFRNDADNNLIDSCIIDLSAVTSTSPDYSAGINFSGSPTNTYTSGNHGSYNIIRNNQIKGGSGGGPYSGINIYGNTNIGHGGNLNNQILNNIITDFYESGIYSQYYISGTQIKGNTISRPNRTNISTFYGIFSSYYNRDVVIDGNKITNPFGGATSSTNPFYGIYMRYNTYTGNIVKNNAIYNINGSGSHYGIYDEYNYASPQGTPLYHNTISLDNSTSKSGANPDVGIYIQYGQNNASYTKEVKNNVISLRHDGAGTYQRTGMVIVDDFFLTSDNNVFYVASSGGTNVVVQKGGTLYNSLAAWQAVNAAQYDQSSMSADPIYVNIVSNVTPTSCKLNNAGQPIAGVSSDITGASRSSLPDPGAYEFNSGGNVDAAISKLVFPSSSSIICASNSTQNIIVKLQNNGTVNLTSATINWKVNGSAQTPYSWTGTITPGNNVDVTIGAYNFATNAINSFIVNSSSPNGGTDACLLNDSVTFSKSMGLSGTYTINPSGGNFTSFTEAIDYMMLNGVCGPVLFNVASATYAGRFAVNPIPGASATNTITFEGISANDVIISENFTNSSSFAIVDLNGADYLTFKNITVKSTNTNYGWGFLFRNKADYNTITNCIIDVGINTTTTNCNGIVFSSSTTSYTVQGNHSNYCTISNNTIKGGYAGIWSYSSSSNTENMNNKILNNDIQDFYVYGISIYFSSPNYLIKGNTIHRPNRTSLTTFTGIYSYQAMNRVIDGNIITNPFGSNPTNGNQFYGISDQWAQSNTGNVISNNLMYNIGCTGGQYGVYNYYSYNTSINHNTIVMDKTTASNGTSYGIYTYAPSSPNALEVKNNIIYMTQPATTTGYYRIGVSYYNGYPFSSNGNVFWINATGATNMIGYNNSSYYSTLASWQGLGKDVNSVVANPNFTSTTNFTPINPAVNGTGVTGQSVVITSDFYGSPRSSTFPDAGAIEWTPLCAGTALTQGTPFQGTFRSGSLNDFDHLKAGDSITYSLSPITGFTNASYGTNWTIDLYAFTTMNANPAGSGQAGWVYPSVAGDGRFQFRPSAAYTDSTMRLIFNVKSLTGNECMTPFVRHIYVAPVPLTDFDTTGGCFTSPLTIKNTTTLLRGGMSFEWNFGDTTSNNTSIQGTPTYSFSHPGVFAVTLKTTSDLGYSSSITKNINISYLPAAKFEFQPVCNGDSVVLVNQTTIPGTPVPINYNWNFGDASNSNSVNPKKLYAGIGTYPVTLTATTSLGCAKTYTRNISVFPVPVADFTATNPCQGANATFTNGTTIAYGNIGYEWDFRDGTTDIVANPVKMYVNQGTYNVKMTAYSEFGCKDSVIKAVTIGTNPTADFSLSKGCLNDSAEFTNSSSTNGGPAITYNWEFGDLGTSTNGNALVNHLYGASGNYTVKLTVTNGACVHSKSSSVTIKANPVSNFIPSGGICQGNATTFSNLSTGPATLSYDWNFGSGTSTDKDPAYTFPGAGTFNVSLKVTSSNGCDHTSSKNISVFPQPTADFGSIWNTPLTMRQVTFTPSAINLYNYNWDFGDGNTSQQVAPVYSYFTNGPFTVKLKVSDINGCVNESDTTIDFIPLGSRSTVAKNFSFDVYPNPFTTQTSIKYELTKASSVMIKLYDMNGKEISTLRNEQQTEGSYSLPFDARDFGLRSGSYMIVMHVNGEIINKQVLITR